MDEGGEVSEDVGIRLVVRVGGEEFGFYFGCDRVRGFCRELSRGMGFDGIL